MSNMLATKGRSAAAAPVLDAAAIRLHQRIDAALLELAVDFGATRRQYPALIATDSLQRGEYPRAFPHLLMAAAPLAEPAAPPEQLLTPGNLASPQWCLSPAVCLHVYDEWAGQQLDGPLLITACGRCFRNEEDTSPGVRQTEFEMREIVLLAEADWIEDMLPGIRSRLEAVAHAQGLDGHWAVAEDPFFLPTAQGKAYLQRLQETKWEYQTGDELALASINRHGTFFGERFGLRNSRGEPLHTACVAMGLDRWRSRCAENADELENPGRIDNRSARGLDTMGNQ